MSNVREVLEALGYTDINERVKEFRMAPLYRESNNDTVLVVRKDSGRWIDYAMGATGDLTDLVKLSLNLTTIEEATQWLENKNVRIATYTPAPQAKITTPKIFDKDNLKRLADDTSYWEGRNVSPELLQRFGGGLAYKGRMAGRYVFPVFNHRDDVVGFAGRDIFNNSSRPPWKLLGDKEKWVYPAFLNHKVIAAKKQVILVESIGDCLALFMAGIENVLVLFGISLGPGILNFLLKNDVNRITIATNNDEVKGESWGNNAASKIRERLLRLFDYNQVEIALPDKKDFGVMSPDEIRIWSQKKLCPQAV